MAFSARTEPCCFGKVFSFGCQVEVTGMKAVSILGKEASARENIEITAKFCLAGEPYLKRVTYRSSYWRMDNELPESMARVSGSIGRCWPAVRNFLLLSPLELCGWMIRRREPCQIFCFVVRGENSSIEMGQASFCAGDST
jgi:hypothetical protein